MNKSFMIAAAALVLAGSASAENVRAREKMQQRRVAQGVRSGELTRKEAVQIEKREAKLHREIRKDRVDGGGLTPQERHKIEHKQDQLSRKIAREKHDKQTR